MEKLLEGYGTRVQFSAFEIWIKSGNIRNLWNEMAGIIDEEEDSVDLYFLNQFERWSYGTEESGTDIDLFIA